MRGHAFASHSHFSRDCIRVKNNLAEDPEHPQTNKEANKRPSIMEVSSSSSPSSATIPLLPLPYQPESRAVEDAIQAALQLIQTYTEDPTDWRDRPEQIYQSLDEARNRIIMAWTNLQSAAAVVGDNAVNNVEAATETGVPTSTSSEQEIRVAFVDMITDAFADVLQHQRDQDEDFDVAMLVDCLQSGLDMMNITNVSSDLAWYEDDDLSDGEGEELDGTAADGTLTPHEQRRRAMGFPVVPEEAPPRRPQSLLYYDTYLSLPLIYDLHPERQNVWNNDDRVKSHSF
jgi:hypothetical protein